MSAAEGGKDKEQANFMAGVPAARCQTSSRPSCSQVRVHCRHTRRRHSERKRTSPRGPGQIRRWLLLETAADYKDEPVGACTPRFSPISVQSARAHSCERQLAASPSAHQHNTPPPLALHPEGPPPNPFQPPHKRHASVRAGNSALIHFSLLFSSAESLLEGTREWSRVFRAGRRFSRAAARGGRRAAGGDCSDGSPPDEGTMPTGDADASEPDEISCRVNGTLEPDMTVKEEAEEPQPIVCECSPSSVLPEECLALDSLGARDRPFRAPQESGHVGLRPDCSATSASCPATHCLDALVTPVDGPGHADPLTGFSLQEPQKADRGRNR
ncbi:uncharacterized protein LOC134532236 [Bacillus rossius redtenbacheri]|uniref:uncharacterized protein LOC134532236 n=1 Tax=Bacillus rossius redtenbacheri TaxID=93214 RepID=UPI002FDC8019